MLHDQPFRDLSYKSVLGRSYSNPGLCGIFPTLEIPYIEPFLDYYERLRERTPPRGRLHSADNYL